MNENNNPLFGGEDNSAAYVNENTSVPFGEDAKEEAYVVAEEEAPVAETSILDDEVPADVPSAGTESPIMQDAADFIPEPSAEEISEAVEEIPADTPDELATAYETPVEIDAYKATESNLYSSDNFTDNFSEDFSSPAPAAEEVPVTESSAFNPYAPKAPEATSNSIPLQNDAQNAPQAPVNKQINPSYNQQLNHNYSQQGTPQQPYGNSYTPYRQPPVPKDNKKGKAALFAIIGVCVVVGLIALVSSLFSGNETPTYDTTATSALPNVNTTVTTETTVPAITDSPAISTTEGVVYNQPVNSIWVAEKVRPSVVGVLAYKQGELAGEGSGVLMSESIAENCTYVVTCAHVINEPRCEFVILLLDGTVHEAEVVALDERTDIGVLKIKKTGLPLAEFGDSSSLKIGEPIYAIGNPGGSEYFGSITNGIVASIDRSISSTYTMTCIQHNAAINPGNSGGALVNTAGQVIGINSSKIARTDFEGMGFAVPSSIFTSVVDALIKHGYVPNRPELGIKYASVSDYQLYSLIVSIKGLPRESVIIAEIPEGSALAGTQAQVGDLIIAVNGKDMDSSDVLLDLIDTGAVGDSLTLTLCRVQDRSYETTTFDVTVQLVEDKGSITTTTQAATLPQQDGYYDSFEDFFGDFFGW